MIPEAYSCDHWLIDLTYIGGIFITYYIVHQFIAPALTEVFAKPDIELLPFCIMPFFYYIFDYAAQTSSVSKGYGKYAAK